MNNYLLFIDTEASGLPKKWNVPYSKENNWPYSVQVAWKIYTKDGNEVKKENHYIRDNDFKISPSAIKIHGITRDFLNENGENRQQVLKLLANDLLEYDPLIVGHFIELDYHVLSADYYRSGIENPLRDRPMFCTMIATRGYLANSPVKYLKLFQLYALLFNATLQNPHNALNDVNATSSCFFELVTRGEISEKDIAMQQQTQKVEKAEKSGCSFAFMLIFFLTVIILYSL